MLLSRVKNPIKLAREMLIRGDEIGGGGAQGHSQLSGEEAERLAREWGCEMVDPEYFWTRRRWEEHLRGLERENEGKGKDVAVIAEFHDPFPCDGRRGKERDEKEKDGNPHWNGKEYLPQGTVGAVVLDRYGTICVATSTGGLTNKLPGRIGDTPTLGAGFWAEEWVEEYHRPQLPQARILYQPSTSETLDKFSRGDFPGLFT